MTPISWNLLKTFSEQGSRLEKLSGWLLSEVWSSSRYASLSSAEYLETGERMVNELEETLARTAPRIYDEFASNLPPEKDISRFLEIENNAVVVFDGLSIRELPALLKLAQESGFNVRETGTAYAATPSETLDFVEQRLHLDKVAPSQLSSRKELKTKGIEAYYFPHPGARHEISVTARSLLMWSAFPDNKYTDSDARFPDLFCQIKEVLKSAWISTVQQIPKGRKILVTSDHGYVYFGPGMSFTRNQAEIRPLTQFFGGERAKETRPGDVLPAHADLYIKNDKTAALIRGRVQCHPPGPNASKLYKHGGMSFMEMFTPWLVLEN